MSDRHTPLLTIVLTGFLSLFLTACGAGKSDTASDVSSRSNNNFGKPTTSEPDDITDNGVSGGTDCNTLAALNNNEFCVL